MESTANALADFFCLSRCNKAGSPKHTSRKDDYAERSFTGASVGDSKRCTLDTFDVIEDNITAYR